MGGGSGKKDRANIAAFSTLVDMVVEVPFDKVLRDRTLALE